MREADWLDSAIPLLTYLLLVCLVWVPGKKRLWLKRYRRYVVPAYRYVRMISRRHLTQRKEAYMLMSIRTLF